MKRCALFTTLPVARERMNAYRHSHSQWASLFHRDVVYTLARVAVRWFSLARVHARA